MTKEQSFENAKLVTLSEMLVDKCDSLFEKLEIKLSQCSRMYIGCCPIHDGDNKTAFNFYSEGHTIRGNWCCRSNQCHKIFKPTILGFIRGVLSSRNGWSKGSHENIYPWASTIKWAYDFLGISPSSITVKSGDKENKLFLKTVDILNKKRINTTGYSREDIVKNLKIPATFFVERGFSPELLLKYDVGLCLKSAKGFMGRAIVPVYDDDGKYMVAFSGRTVNPLCSKCNSYHLEKAKCPEASLAHLYSKWKHTPNINNYLYNYWNAKKFIKQSKKIILVEGPCDVWKLEELGVRNSVAIFGTDITEQQQLILETSGAFDVIILTDSDHPGRMGAESIESKLKNSYNIKIPEYSKHDPGEFDKEDIKFLL